MALQELFEITDREFELIKITLIALKKFSKFDSLKIYEGDTYFEIVTVCKSENYITKTKIGKTRWKVKECICHKVGEQEIKIK